MRRATLEAERLVGADGHDVARAVDGVGVHAAGEVGARLRVGVRLAVAVELEGRRRLERDVGVGHEGGRESEQGGARTTCCWWWAVCFG